MNIFPPVLPTTNTSILIPSLIIYTDNTDSSKSKNMEIYNEANRWKNAHSITYGFYPGKLNINELIIDGKTISSSYNKYFIFGAYMVLEINGGSALYINNDGSVDVVINLSLITG